MLNGNKILALIPARGGSKGLLGKNVRILFGKPLICHSIELGLRSKLIDRVIVSTDSPQIARIAKRAGAEVPFLRPSELAQDLTHDLPVVKHCMGWLKDNEKYVPDLMVFLRPTGPLRILEELEEAIRILQADPEADSIRSAKEPHAHPYKMFDMNGRFLVPLVKEFKGIRDSFSGPRQALPKVYQTTPDIHVLKIRAIFELDSLLGRKVLPYFLKHPTVDIEDEFDLEIAEYMMERTRKHFTSS